jgi:hypothetical protein
MQSIWPTHLLPAEFLSLIMAAPPDVACLRKKIKTQTKNKKKTARQYSLDSPKD